VSTCAALLFSGLDLGSDPAPWRFSLEPIPSFLFRAIELFDFEQDAWREIDLAALACRECIAVSLSPVLRRCGYVPLVSYSLSSKEPFM